MQEVCSDDVAPVLRVAMKPSAKGTRLVAGLGLVANIYADDLAGEKIFDVRTDPDDFTDELMTDNHRHGGSFFAPTRPICKSAG